MSDLLKVKVGGSSYLCKWTDPRYVEIGGREYLTMKIGNQVWLAENLDYKFYVNGNQIPIGSSGTPSTPAAWYYRNDETSYGIDGTYKCGLLYNWYATKYLNDNKATLLPVGWRVANNTDWNGLISSVGSNAGTKLKALDGSVIANWPNGWNGTDVYGFNGLPSGNRTSSGSFNGISVLTTYWSTDQPYYSSSYSLNINSTVVVHNDIDSVCGGYIRLVKNLT